VEIADITSKDLVKRKAPMNKSKQYGTKKPSKVIPKSKKPRITANKQSIIQQN
jgi:hypothetical protein